MGVHKRRYPGSRRVPSGYSRAGAQRVGKKLRTMGYTPYRARRRSSVNYRTGGFIGIEKKFYDTSLVGGVLAIATTGAEHNPSATLNFCTMAQGDGEENRDGRRATVKSVFVNGTVSIAKQTNQTSVDDWPTIFIALVWDKQTNGAPLNSEDVYGNKSGDSTLSASMLRNLQFSSRFRILASAQFRMIPSADAVFDGTNFEIPGFTRPFKLSWSGNMPVEYKGTTADVANITNNSIQLVAYCTNNGTAPLINYNARTRFVG